MNPVPPRPTIAWRCLVFARATSAVAVLAGCALLLGWHPDLGPLEDALPRSSSMKPNTAIGFILLGIALWLSAWPGRAAKSARETSRSAAIACAVVASLIGFATIVEHLIAVDLAIDQLFSYGTRAAHGRMALASAVEFVIFGSALVLIDVEVSRGRWPAQYLAIVGMVIGAIALTSYAYDVSSSGWAFHFGSMAMPTAVLFSLLGWGILCSRPDRDIVATVTNEGLGGHVARRALPVALLLPFTLDGLQKLGERADLFPVDFGVALFSTIDAVIFGAIVWSSANYVCRTEAGRHHADEIRLRLGAIVESSDDPIISETIDGTIVSWNGGAERVFGYTAAEAVNGGIAIIIPADRREEERRILMRLRQGDRVEHFETVCRRKDGVLLDAAVTVSPILNAAGRIVGVSKIVRDLTDRKRADREIRRLQIEQERFFALSIDLLCISSIDGYFKSVSPALEPLLGYTAEEFMARPLMDYVHPDDVASTAAEVERVSAGMATISFENRYRCKDGSYKWLSWRSAPDLKTGWRYAIARDVTDERMSRDTLRSSLAEKEVLLKEIHHRVKNNMQVVASLLSLQANASEVPQLRASLMQSQSRVYAMAVVHEALCDSGNLAAVDFAALAQKLWTYLMQTFARTGLAVGFHADVDVPLLPIDQAVPCALIVTEIFSNALKHAFPEGIRGSVALDFRSVPAHPGLLRLRIADDGCGFTEDARARAVERGSIGHQIIGALGEQLGATSVWSGPGTTFAMTFATHQHHTAPGPPS